MSFDFSDNSHDTDKVHIRPAQLSESQPAATDFLDLHAFCVADSLGCRLAGTFYLWTTDDPSTPQIDTQLKQPADDPSVPDWVFVEADEPSLPITGEDLGAGANLLEKVRDDTTFRDGDREAWFAIWMTLRSTDPRLYRNFSEKPVGFVELFGQPRAFAASL